MGIWKRRKKETGEEYKETLPSEQTAETDTSGGSASEIAGVQGKSKNSEQEIAVPATHEEQYPIHDDVSSGVILYGKKVSGLFKKGFWGIVSILILPPICVFAFGITIVAFMLIFPLLGVVLAAAIPIVFATLSIFLIVLPVIFPLLILFILITGKGRLLIGSEGKWLGLEIFGKNYSLR